MALPTPCNSVLSHLGPLTTASFIGVVTNCNFNIVASLLESQPRNCSASTMLAIFATFPRILKRSRANRRPLVTDTIPGASTLPFRYWSSCTLYYSRGVRSTPPWCKSLPAFARPHRRHRYFFAPHYSIRNGITKYSCRATVFTAEQFPVAWATATLITGRTTGTLVSSRSRSRS
jgi:hypothetical protein